MFWNGNDVAMVCGRTLDWETSDEPRLWIIPRGTARTGGVGPGSATWTTRYGTLSMQGWGVATTEAVKWFQAFSGLDVDGIFTVFVLLSDASNMTYATEDMEVFTEVFLDCFGFCRRLYYY